MRSEIEVSSDNAASLHMIQNGSETAWRTRHISAKALWMHQRPAEEKIPYQPTAEWRQSLTKGLGASRLPQIREDLLSRRRLGLAQCGYIQCHFVIPLELFIESLRVHSNLFFSMQTLSHNFLDRSIWRTRRCENLRDLMCILACCFNVFSLPCSNKPCHAF